MYWGVFTNQELDQMKPIAGAMNKNYHIEGNNTSQYQHEQIDLFTLFSTGVRQMKTKRLRHVCVYIYICHILCVKKK